MKAKLDFFSTAFGAASAFHRSDFNPFSGNKKPFYPLNTKNLRAKKLIVTAKTVLVKIAILVGTPNW